MVWEIKCMFCSKSGDGVVLKPFEDELICNDCKEKLDEGYDLLYSDDEE